MTPERLILFIDDKNFYHGARRAFFAESDPHFYGQIDPIKLANLICSRPSLGDLREIHQVRVYTGVPDSTKQPKTYAANMKQNLAWQSFGAEVITRTLRYPIDWPKSRAEQKGIDVALAVDFVALAIDGEYDVGIIASTDTDLKPALEFVKRKCSDRCHIEVAAWSSSRTKSRLSISSAKLWCHWLHKADYDAVADLTDYNIRS